MPNNSNERGQLSNNGIKTITEAMANSIEKKISHTDGDFQVFDNVPNIRKYVDGQSGNGPTFYGEDSDAGAINTLKTYQKFRQGRESGEDPFINGYVYCFITKPNLNLKPNPKNVSSNSTSEETDYNTCVNGFIHYIANNYPEIINSLTYSTENTNGIPMFIPLLFNNYKSTSLEDHNFLESTYHETYRGFGQRLPTTAGTSMAGGSISISYNELATPLVTYLHKVWFDYIEGIKFGMLEPTQNTIDKKEIDYASSMYLFITAPDGETIKFWCKYTGLFPQNVPYSSFDGTLGDIKVLDSVNCSYIYSYKEFLMPEIFQDFNDVFDGGAHHELGSTTNLDLMFYDNKDEADLSEFCESSDVNPNEIPTESNIIDGYKYLSPNAFSSVGVIKKGKDYKLIFYN